MKYMSDLALSWQWKKSHYYQVCFSSDNSLDIYSIINQYVNTYEMYIIR